MISVVTIVVSTRRIGNFNILIKYDYDCFVAIIVATCDLSLHHLPVNSIIMSVCL